MFKIGDESEDVAKLQYMLNAQLGKTKGYVPLLVDGKHGAKTQDAVDLLASLVLKKGDTGEDVKDLQQKLNKFFAIAGLSIIDVDGIFGGATHDAVVEFQEKSFLKEDGIAGPKTMQALIKATEPKETARELGKRLEVHLYSDHISTRVGSKSNMACRLHSLAKPMFNLSNGLTGVFDEIVKFLKVEESKRYQKANGKTYCNIYAYDYCSFTWAYLPRVYWKRLAFHAILEGEAVDPVYASTVKEYTADMLFHWLCDSGQKYHGWTKVATAAEAQEAVNNGAVGLICADRRTKGKSGHITVILPGELKDGAPRQSQAGATNRKDFHSSWYLGGQFLDYGFFVNYSPKG